MAVMPEVPQVKMVACVPMAVVRASKPAAMPTAAMSAAAMSAATMSAASGCIAHDRERSRGERSRSNGGREEGAGDRHRTISERLRKDPPGRIRPGGPIISICLVGGREVADVDVAVHVRAPHPARRRATGVEAEVAVVTVVVVTVVTVVVVTVVVVDRGGGGPW